MTPLDFHIRIKSLINLMIKDIKSPLCPLEILSGPTPTQCPNEEERSSRKQLKQNTLQNMFRQDADAKFKVFERRHSLC